MESSKKGIKRASMVAGMMILASMVIGAFLTIFFI